jgi:hypothetical protein
MNISALDRLSLDVVAPRCKVYMATPASAFAAYARCGCSVGWDQVRDHAALDEGPEFEALPSASYGQAIARLQQVMPLAVQTMLKVLLRLDTPASVRVRAADAITNRLHKAIEIETVA